MSLRIKRIDSNVDHNVKTSILIDGEKCAEVGDNETVEFDLPIGEHIIKFKTKDVNSLSYNTTTRSGTDIDMFFSANMPIYGYHRILKITYTFLPEGDSIGYTGGSF